MESLYPSDTESSDSNRSNDSSEYQATASTFLQCLRDATASVDGVLAVMGEHRDGKDMIKGLRIALHLPHVHHRLGPSIRMVEYQSWIMGLRTDSTAFRGFLQHSDFADAEFTGHRLAAMERDRLRGAPSVIEDVIRSTSRGYELLGQAVGAHRHMTFCVYKRTLSMLRSRVQKHLLVHQRQFYGASLKDMKQIVRRRFKMYYCEGLIAYTEVPRPADDPECPPNGLELSRRAVQYCRATEGPLNAAWWAEQDQLRNVGTHRSPLTCGYCSETAL